MKKTKQTYPPRPSNATRAAILRAARTQVAEHGADALSMRTLGRELGIVQSVLYYYFPDKASLLRAMFDDTNTLLGQKRRSLPTLKSFPELLLQRIAFQFDEREAVTAVLKYYLHARRSFPKRSAGGYVPEKAALHIEEILIAARSQGVLLPEINISESAKVIAHAINGFVMEYYPAAPVGQEREQVIRAIAELVYPALTGKRFPGKPRAQKRARKGGDQL